MMKSEEEIKGALKSLEFQANQYEDLYEENFVAIKALRWILGMEPPVDERQREDDE